jgi:hypothetical protein
MHNAELLFDEVETRQIFKFFCPQLGGAIDHALIRNKERRLAQMSMIRAVDLTFAPQKTSPKPPSAVTVRVPLRSVFKKLEISHAKFWWRYAKKNDLRSVHISTRAFDEVSSALCSEIDDDRAEVERLRKRYPPVTATPIVKRSLCDAMVELSKTAKTNPLLNGTPFSRDMLGGEVPVDGSGSPYKHHFTDARNNLEYDIQYIQVGWSLTKTYGEGAATSMMTGYMIFGPGAEGSIQILKGIFGQPTSGEDDFGYFKKENLAANFRGLQLGEFGARRFARFEDFVTDLCAKSPGATR